MKTTIHTIVDTFLQNLQVSYETLLIEQTKENTYKIKIISDESAQLIGHHGKNLEAIRHILKIIINNQSENRIKLFLEVNDYQTSKDTQLKNFVISKVKRVEETGTEIQLPYYTPYERMKIHGFVSEYGNEKIYTESKGEGENRRLYICKKREKLSIDLDGVSI